MVNTNPKRRGYLSLGSGRAICQLCDEKIAKGVPQINHRANRCTASFHANAKDCGVPRSKKYIKEAGCSNCGMVLIAEKGNCLNCFTMNAENFEAQRITYTCDQCGMSGDSDLDYCSHCDMDFCDSCDHFGDFRISGFCEDSVNMVIEDSQYIARKGERRAETDLSKNADYTKGYTDVTEKVQHKDKYGRPKETVVQSLTGYAGNCPSCNKRINFPIGGGGLYCNDCQVYLLPSREKGLNKTLRYDAESSNTKLLGIGAGILATIFYMYFQK